MLSHPGLLPSRPLSTLSLAIAFAFVFLLPIPPALAKEYTYTEIPAPPGWTSVTFTGMNSAHTVVGFGNDASGLKQAFMCSGGVHATLLNSGAQPGRPWHDMEATAINDNGVIAGHFMEAAPFWYWPFSYNNGAFASLDFSHANSIAGININGDIVGAGKVVDWNVAMLCSNGLCANLSLPDWHDSGATAINDQGDVTIWARLYDHDTGLFYDAGFVRKAGNYLPLGKNLIPANINNNGDIVGRNIRYGEAGLTGFLYSRGKVTNILPPGWCRAAAHGINSSRDVVGSGKRTPDGPYVGFLYSNAEYTEIIPPGWQSSNAMSIKDDGTIFGSGTDANGITKAFIATDPPPTADPAVSPGSESSGGDGLGGGGESSGGGGSSGGGCFIATAAYGDDAVWQVKAFKDFRDRYLLTNAPGRIVVANYYAISPHLAGPISRHPALRSLVRSILTPVAYALIHPYSAALFLAFEIVAIVSMGRRILRVLRGRTRNGKTERR